MRRVMEFTGLAKLAGAVLKVILTQGLIRSNWVRWLIGIRGLHSSNGVMVFAAVAIFAATSAKIVSAVWLTDSLGIL